MPDQRHVIEELRQRIQRIERRPPRADRATAYSAPSLMIGAEGAQVKDGRSGNDIKLPLPDGRYRTFALKRHGGGIVGVSDVVPFTITNGGVFGSLLSTPIINPPQSAILGMHNIVERPIAVNGKVEALNASFQKECVTQTEFMDLTDAARGIGRWVEHYNHRRTHHGLGGLLVPADRFYGVAEQTLKKIEQGLGADTTELTSIDSRGLDLFRIVSYGGKAQVWLMGEKILG